MKRHLKRINAPKTWKIQRRGIKFITKSNPGGMEKDLTVPISNILKYNLKVATNTRDVKYLINNGDVFVNHKKISDYRYPVCFTDILTLANENYRMIIDTDGILKNVPVSKEDSKLKILKIIGKSQVKGKTQLNMINGMNILLEKHHYKVNDSLLVSVPENIVKEHLSLEKGALALLYKGKHIGKIGTLQEIRGSSVVVKTGNDTYETKKEYVIIVGKDKPLVKMTK
ncbi:MAG: S4 domain-containing protein [Candidatus Woesearchaeota archaeon]